MKEGADDYILKPSLKRLPSAVLNALEKQEAERGKERAVAALMDMNLMMVNGLVATNLICGIEGPERIPVVAMGGFASTELRQAAMAAGCDEFATRPIKFAVFPRAGFISGQSGAPPGGRG